MPKKGEKTSKPEFKEGDLVVAKVRGYPAWPGFIESCEHSSNRKKNYVVRFFYTKDKSKTLVSLKPFEEMTASEKECNRKGFAEAMQECQTALISGQHAVKKGSSRVRKLKRNKAIKEEHTADEEKKDSQEEDDDMIEKNGADNRRSSTSISVQDEQQTDASAPATPKTSSSNQDNVSQDEAGPDDMHKEGEETFASMDHEQIIQKAGSEADAVVEPVANDEVNSNLVNVEENNNTENATQHDDKNGRKLDCLPNLSSPDDEHDTRASKVEDPSKHCSLNDLTSEQANADRGTEPPNNKASNTPVSRRELTLAKLKKKIDTKLREKAEKKAAFRDQKSFEKALKGLPTLIRKFKPLSKSTARLIKNTDSEQAAGEVRTSMRECEKHLQPLAKCLKLMTSVYGQQQRKCYEFHCTLRQIVERLKEIKAQKSLPISRDCSNFLREMKDIDEIKRFMNEMNFPLYNDSGADRKENSRVKRKSAMR